MRVNPHFCFASKHDSHFRNVAVWVDSGGRIALAETTWSDLILQLLIFSRQQSTQASSSRRVITNTSFSTPANWSEYEEREQNEPKSQLSSFRGQGLNPGRAWLMWALPPSSGVPQPCQDWVCSFAWIEARTDPSVIESRLSQKPSSRNMLTRAKCCTFQKTPLWKTEKAVCTFASTSKAASRSASLGCG